MQLWKRIFSKYASDFVKLNELTKEKEAAEQQLEEKMERWMYLEPGSKNCGAVEISLVDSIK